MSFLGVGHTSSAVSSLRLGTLLCPPLCMSAVRSSIAPGPSLSQVSVQLVYETLGIAICGSERSVGRENAPDADSGLVPELDIRRFPEKPGRAKLEPKNPVPGKVDRPKWITDDHFCSPYTDTHSSKSEEENVGNDKLNGNTKNASDSAVCPLQCATDSKRGQKYSKQDTHKDKLFAPVPALHGHLSDNEHTMAGA